MSFPLLRSHLGTATGRDGILLCNFVKFSKVYADKTLIVFIKSYWGHQIARANSEYDTGVKHSLNLLFPFYIQAQHNSGSFV